MEPEIVAVQDNIEYDVTVLSAGPLFIRLKLNNACCTVERFEKDFFGNPSEIELSGKVCVGDILLSVNGISIGGMSIGEIQSTISSTPVDNPRIFRFRREQRSNTTMPTQRLIAASAAPLRRIDLFHGILREKLINEGKLRNLSANGIPDQSGVRGIIWRLLLRFLPLEMDLWEARAKEKRLYYEELCTRYFVDQSATLKKAMDDSILCPSNDGMPFDHPLSQAADSSWKNYLSDLALMEEIEKDVIRTHPDISFFIDDCANPTVKRNMLRILFVFAKQHPHIRYVQGMNDLCGTLYYVFASDESAVWRQHAEPDTYHCFENLVLENKDMYIKSLDETVTGIHGRIERFNELLRVHDNILYLQFRSQGIDPSFYGLRWLTTLLCREFNLPDTIRLWDALFADTDRSDFLSYVCCTMIMVQHEILASGDFASNLQLLQSYPHIDIIELLHRAMSIRSEDRSRAQDFIWNGGESVLFSTTVMEGASFSQNSLSQGGGGSRYPRLSALSAPFLTGTGPTLQSVSNLLSTAEAGVRKLFSEKSNWTSVNASSGNLSPSAVASPGTSGKSPVSLPLTAGISGMNMSTEGDLK